MSTEAPKGPTEDEGRLGDGKSTLGGEGRLGEDRSTDCDDKAQSAEEKVS